MNPISVKRNNYMDNTKDSTILTPKPLCEWLSSLIIPELKDEAVIFDPCVGTGNLLYPFFEKKMFVTVGNDIKNREPKIDINMLGDFLEWEKIDFVPDFVIMNPPYNHDDYTRKKYGKRSLLPELFLRKIFQLWKNVPVLMFAPMGFRLNQRCYTEAQGERYQYLSDKEITTIITLPLDIFPNPNYRTDIPEERRNPKKGVLKSNIKRTETQQEIIVFNFPKLKPHYFVPKEILDEIRDSE